MRPRDANLAAHLDGQLHHFANTFRPLPGINAPAERNCFIEQLLESIHRVQYTQVIQQRSISPSRQDPNSELFDPLKAALLMLRAGKHDEACWLVFLSVHFGKHLKSGWELTRNFYGKLGQGGVWDWATASANPTAIKPWLAANQTQLIQTGSFGNHRRYQSIDAHKNSGTGNALESYINWVLANGTHRDIVRTIHQNHGQNPRDTFRHMYKELDAVTSFGRLAKFDYLTMLGKLGLAPIEPDSAYMNGATGPFEGSKLLFGTPNATRNQLDSWLVDLDGVLALSFGMQVLEDALCNWQKSPAIFVQFRG